MCRFTQYLFVHCIMQHFVFMHINTTLANLKYHISFTRRSDKWPTKNCIWYTKCTYYFIPNFFLNDEVYSIQHYVIIACQLLAAGWWFSPGTPFSSANKTDRHDITEILLKVALNTITLTPYFFLCKPEPPGEFVHTLFTTYWPPSSN